MILIKDPYYNEPGYERSAGTAQGKSASEAYDKNIRSYNLNHALLPALEKPPPAFAELLKYVFFLFFLAS